jgi:hypothetical protein
MVYCGRASISIPASYTVQAPAVTRQEIYSPAATEAVETVTLDEARVAPLATVTVARVEVCPDVQAPTAVPQS